MDNQKLTEPNKETSDGSFYQYPIAVYPSGFGNEGTYSVSIGKPFPADGDEYFCTLTEARNAGWGGHLYRAPEDAKRLYP